MKLLLKYFILKQDNYKIIYFFKKLLNNNFFFQKVFIIMLSSNSFSFEQFQILDQVQSKEEEEIYLIEDLDTKNKYLQKIDKIFSEQDQELFISNIGKIEKISNYPGLLSIIGYIPQPPQSIIMEYKEYGTLRNFIISKQAQNNYQDYFTDTKKYINLIGIAYTIQYLHGHNIFIRNIDSNDIFLDENLYPHICITPLINDKIDYFISWPRDVFLFSLIAYELITGTTAMIGIDENVDSRPDLSKISSEWQKQFLEKCWSKYEIQRPNIFDIIQELESNKSEFGNIDEEELKQFEMSIQTYLSNYSKEVKKNCSEKDPDWFFIYGNMLANGYGISMNKIKATRYYKLAAEKGHISSIFNYALILENFSGFFSRKKEAKRFYKKACKQGHSTSMFNYALMLYNGDGIPINKEKAARYFKFSADLGNVNSMFNIALMLEKGEGVEVNKEEAANYYKMSADHGNVTAMNNYASMLKKGIGTKKNKKLAAVYFKTAADFGNSFAMFNYAFMLKTGNGIKKNMEESVRYFRLASEQGNNSAAFNLALLLYNGDGIVLDKKEAARYFKLAADNENVDAMFNYALMLKNGDGIEMNKPEAIRYFKMAANRGNSNAMDQYRRLTKFTLASM